MASKRSVREVVGIGVAACAVTALALVAGCGGPSAPPRPKPFTPPVAKVSEEARGVIDRMAGFISGKKGFALRQTTTATVSDEALAAKLGGTTEHLIRVGRPSRLFVATGGDRKGGGTVASDGTALLIHDTATNRYESTPAPESVQAIVAHPLVGGMLAVGGDETIARVLLADDPAAALLEGVRKLDVAGTGSIDGRECVHLTAETEGSGWHLWIAAGDEPVPVKFEPAKGRISQEGKEVDVATTVTLDQWRFDPEFGADEFTFGPPEGAEKVASIIAAAEEEARRKRAARPSLHPTVGFPASKSTFVGLDGERFDPTAHREKIVVLDFWATWCGPCRESLPTVARVCSEYADKDVLFRAVNVKEDEETIRKFLAEAAIDATVVMDPSGESMAAYLVDAIPHTVVIGKDGVIQAVHVGSSDRLEERLRKQLDALGEGKSLVPRPSGNMAPRADPI